MGATSMPRMNVLSSLLCRDIFAAREASEPKLNSENSMQNSRRHGGSVGMHSPGMDMNGTAGNLSASSIIIGEYNPQCSIKEVESAAAMLNLWGNLIAGIIGAIATLFWGKISDQYGRVKPLAAAATVILVSDFVMVLIAKFPDVLPLNLVYLAFVLEGIRSVSTYMYILFDAYSVSAVLSFLP
jgi:MFS family permease